MYLLKIFCRQRRGPNTATIFKNECTHQMTEVSCKQKQSLEFYLTCRNNTVLCRFSLSDVLWLKLHFSHSAKQANKTIFLIINYVNHKHCKYTQLHLVYDMSKFILLRTVAGLSRWYHSWARLTERLHRELESTLQKTANRLDIM